jgi:hypothetical protein
LKQVRRHLEAALGHLNLDDELDRLVNPRHTDHDRHVYLLTKVAKEIAAAREAVQAAIEALEKEN